MKRNKTLLLLIFSLLFIAKLSFGETNKQVFRVVFYNVENLFDTEDNPLTIDEEFLPNGNRFWNEKKFYTKLNRVFQVLMAAGEGNPPSVIGFAEIENRKVLELLLYKTPLGKMGYEIVHQESPDRRGIDVAFLYRRSEFQPINYKAIPVIDPNDNSFKTRDVLYVKGILAADTVNFFINHWPSKYGGTVETKPLRALAAQTLKAEIDSLFEINPKCKILAMGDFNDSPFDESITKYLGAVGSFNETNYSSIVNLAYPLAANGKGSNKYQGKWELIDQILVSNSFGQSSGLTTTLNDFKVFDADFILEDDKNFLGKKPFRTYLGFKYNNGFSDHLPVIVDLKTMTE